MKFSHTIQTSAPPSKIWAIWIDVDNWSDWDTELSRAYLESSFGLGARGKLIPKVGSISKFTISQLDVGVSYTFIIRLPLCNLRIYRCLQTQSNSTYFTHTVSFQGLFAPIFGFLLGRRFRIALPKVMEKIKQIAESEG